MNDTESRRRVICHMCLHEPSQDPRLLRAARAGKDLYDVRMVGMDRGRGLPPTMDVEGMSVHNLQVRTRRLPRNLVFWAVKYLEFMLRAASCARRQKADIIHAHDLAMVPVALLASRGTKAKVIYDAHELYPDTGGPGDRRGLLYRLVCRTERWIVRRVDAIVAANSARAKVMQDRYALAEPPVCVQNISESVERVESRRAQDYVKERGGPPGPVVFYQGLIEKARGLHNLIAAMAHVPEGISLVLLGQQQGRIVEETIAEAGVADRVFHHPRVSAEEVHQWSCSADVGVVIYRNTGLNNYLCAPNKLYEYLMSGIPVLGCDFPTVQEVVETYKVGALFDPESPASIGQAITKLLGDEQGLAQARANIPRALAAFTWDHEKERLLDLYARLARDGEPAK